MSGSAQHVVLNAVSGDGDDSLAEWMLEKATPRPDERERGVVQTVRVSGEYAGTGSVTGAYWPKYTESRPSCLIAIARPVRTPAAACAP